MADLNAKIDLDKVARLRSRLAQINIERRQLEYELSLEMQKRHPGPASEETQAIEKYFYGKGLAG